jgi:2,3-dihydroxyphenylpropionate 1,2-dioxygenase
MEVDHGVSQPLEVLLGSIGARPTVPVFVNAAAPPRAPFARARALGAAVGRWAAALDRRVLLVGSGGLAHDPPTPLLEGAPPELRERLVVGSTAEARAAREAGVAELAHAFVAGRAPLLPLDAAFDAAFVELVAEGRLAEVDAWHDDELTARHGRAVHEVRTWVAALSGLAAVGPYEVVHRHVQVVPEWIVGYGALAARPA